MFALGNSQCPCQGLSSACACGRHIHEAVAADTGRAVERVDVWTFHAKRMPSSVRWPMYRITGHYPIVSSVGLII
jgi:hypothetical protein